MPAPKRGTRYRIVGPFPKNGMSTWRVFDVRTGQQVGPDCFSFEEARGRVEDLARGKRLFWFGNIPMKLKPIY